MSNSTTRPLPTEGPSAGGGDEFDDLFDYDVDINDPFSENYVSANAKNSSKEVPSKEKSGSGLGIDEEVEVTRKPRAPRVKLDENRLLSSAGIPKLRSKAKHHLKFKGKGHEYSDISKLLSFYQLWLDDLFPKARFLDALAMVEKMGHKKRMQMMRMEWINQGKPHNVHEDSLFDEPEPAAQEDGEREKTAPRVAPIFEARASERPKTPALQEDGFEELYDATPRQTNRPAESSVPQINSIFGGSSASIFAPRPMAESGPPDDDDLDALLAEEEMLQATSGNSQALPVVSKAPAPKDSFEDEMEAMAEMDMDDW